MDRKQRRSAILRIISEREVETQNELILLLKKEGFDVTQATVSRDIRELKIQKGISENGVNCYYAGISTGDGSAAGRIEYGGIFTRAVNEIDYAGNIVVIKCQSGFADAVCRVVDELKSGLVVGTIAGDDTIFILTRSETHAAQLLSQLKTAYGR